MRTPRRLSDRAKAIWKRTVPQMERAGLIIEADREALELYVATMADVEELELLLSTVSRTTVTSKGTLQSSPVWTQLRQARQDASKFQVQLGLTPKSRKTLGVSGDDGDDGSEGDFK